MARIGGAVAVVIILGSAHAALAGWDADELRVRPWAGLKLRMTKADMLQALKAADANGDGKLSAREARALRGVFDPGGWGVAGFKHADKNGDGLLSLAELKVAHAHQVHLIKKGLYEYDERLRKRLLTPGIDARERDQVIRIRNGIANGSLTPAEAKALLKGEKAIRAMERKAKSDGKLTGEERKELHQALDRLSRGIYKAKHDKDKRPRATLKPKPRPKPRTHRPKR